jgi:acetyl esterase/lipase
VSHQSMTRLDDDARAASFLTWLAAISCVGTAVASFAAPDKFIRRLLPGTASAISVVPLFLISLVRSEFPLHSLVVEAAMSARLVVRSRHRTRSKLALAALVVSWWGLVKASAAAKRAPAVLDESLAEQFGSDFRLRLPESLARDTALRLQDTWIPKLSERRRYLRHENLSYGEAGIRNRLDIWHRRDLPPGAAAPVLIQIHGSAWVTGSKRGQGYPLMAHMAERGWVCVTINYSLAPAARWPAHIVDVKRAIAWVKREIATYGGDPQRIALTGGSAGGHLSSLAALTANELIFQPGFEDDDTSVQAAVPFYGLYDLLDRAGEGPAEQEEFLTKIVIGRSRGEAFDIWSQGSPMSWLRSDAPPFFILHGTIDTMTSPVQARTFSEGLRAVSKNPVLYAELPGAQHMFDSFPTVRGAATVAAVDRFLTLVLDR